MTKPIFMSQDHVDRMNKLLDGAATVEAACARLDRNYSMTYEVLDGPNGTEYWTLRFDRETGASFTLEQPAHTDVTMVVEWTETMRYIKAAVNGEEQGDRNILEVRGDESVVDRVDEAFKAAHDVSLIPAEIPDV